MSEQSDRNYDNLTREEAIDAGLIEGDAYRDFAPPDDFDQEAYDEMCWQDRLERDLGLSLRRREE